MTRAEAVDAALRQIEQMQSLLTIDAQEVMSLVAQHKCALHRLEESYAATLRFADQLQVMTDKLLALRPAIEDEDDGSDWWKGGAE